MVEPLKTMIAPFDIVVSTLAATTPNGLAVAKVIQETPILVTKPQSVRHRADDPSSAEWGKSSKDGRRYVVLGLAICK